MFSLKLNCEKEQAIQYIRNINDSQDFIRLCPEDHHDVCLELTWREHGDPYVEYLYFANIENHEMVGEIIEFRKTNKNKKLSIKEWLPILFGMFLFILVIYGGPFLFLFLLSGKLFISLGFGIIPLIVLPIFIIKKSDHIPIHKKNIIIALAPILGNKI